MNNKPATDIIPKTEKIDTGNKRDSVSDTTNIVLLPLDTSWFQFKNSRAATLSGKEMKLIEALITKCIQHNNDNQDASKHILEYIDLKNYKRQYFPYINEWGEKLVWINCFCKSDFNFNDWKKEIVIVADGGSCFFNVTINLTKKKYEQFSTNGYA